MECIVLAGGMGTRLKSVVSDIPKCMAPVAGNPFLHYIISNLESYGFSHIILALGYRHQYVEKWIKTIPCSSRISYIVENEPLGTGGAVKNALKKAYTDDVFILNGDTFFDINFRKMLAFHKSCAGKASIALKKMYDFQRYGTVEKAENHIILKFKEKTFCKEGLINGGIYILKKDILNTLPDKFSLEKDFFEAQTKNATDENGLYGFVSEGYFIDIGIPEDYSAAQKDFSCGKNKPFDTLFLDRDGVINVLRKNDYVKKPEEFIFIEGSKEALRKLSSFFRRILIVSNQRGVGKGVMSICDLDSIHSYMLEQLNTDGVKIDKIYTCTDIDDHSMCRKPNTGMAIQAKKDFPELDFSKSLMIGDSDSDIYFGLRAGIPAIKIGEKGKYPNLITFANHFPDKL